MTQYEREAPEATIEYDGEDILVPCLMWPYRDRSSPFYSGVGVTENERPVLAHEVAAVFRCAGFDDLTERE